jgi:hypothetical protein
LARAAAAGLVAAVLAAGAAQAQGARDFCADRPGKATPACILDRGRLQVETGLADVSLDRGPDSYLLGQTEARLGVTRRTELEATLTPLSHSDGRSGFGDLSFGFRSALTDPDGKGAAVSWQAFATAPTATHGQGAGGWEAGARLPVAADLADGFSLGLTPEADLRRDTDGHGRHAVVSGAVALSHDLAGASVAVEVWGEHDADPAGHVNQASFDLSAAWMLDHDLQLDAGANAGLTRATPGVEVYVGVARRF